MDQALKGKVEGLRSWSREHPDGVVWVEVHDGYAGSDPPPNRCLDEFYDFLRVSNGASFDTVVLWSHEELPQKRFLMSHLPDEGADAYCIGRMFDEPLVVHQGASDVLMYPRHRHGEQHCILGRLDRFLDHDVLGPGALEAIADGDTDDNWYHLLMQWGFC